MFFFFLFTAMSLLHAQDVSDEEDSLDEAAVSSEAISYNEENDVIEDSSIDDDFYFEAPPLIFEAPVFEIRSFDDVFPGFSQRQRSMVLSNEGLRHFFSQGDSPAFAPNPNSQVNLFSRVMEKNPSHLIETLVLVPYNEREFDLLDIFNSLGRVEKIKYHSAVLNGIERHLFAESSRIESSDNRIDIPDPMPAEELPFSDTMHVRLHEINFGDLFIRSDVSVSLYGMTYSMTNFTDVHYFFIPIIRAERFICIIYLEPVEEGVIIYSMTGFNLPAFLADWVNITPNINGMIGILVSWITEGLREQEDIIDDLLEDILEISPDEDLFKYEEQEYEEQEYIE